MEPGTILHSMSAVFVLLLLICGVLSGRSSHPLRYNHSMWQRRVLPLLMMFLSGCGWRIGVPASAASATDNRTPLERAVQEGNLVEVEHLLASGSDPNDKSCPLAVACLRKGNAEVVRTLIRAGANPNGRMIQEPSTRCWVSPLSYAARIGDAEITATLLDAGASLNQPQCLPWNLGWLQPPILDVLVSHGLNIQSVDEYGRNQKTSVKSPLRQRCRPRWARAGGHV